MAELSVDIDVNTGSAVSDVNKLAGAFTDAEQEILALVDAGRKVGKSNADIARDLSKIDGRNVRDARQEIDRLDKAVRDLDKSTNDIDPGKKVSKSFKDGFRDAREEAGQSGREAAASFSGGFEDVADFVQETLANALGGFGPLGAAAGIALAAVIGTVLSETQLTQERLEEARSKATELANTMYENGGNIPLQERVSELIETLGSERLARNPLEQIANDFVDLGTNIDSTRKAAREADVPLSRLVSSLTGSDIGATKDSLREVNEELERLNQESGNVDAGSWQARKDALTTVRSELEQVISRTELANELYNSTEFLNSQRVDELAEKWRNAATDAGSYITTMEDGSTAFDASAYLADAEAQIAAADELKRRLVVLPPEIRAEAEAVFGSQGAVAANAYAAAYESASAADKGRYENAARANGEAAGQAQGKSFVSGFANPEVTARVRVVVDRSEWDNWTPRQKTAYVRAHGLREVV